MDPQLRDSLQRRAAEDVAAAVALLSTLSSAKGAQAEAVRRALRTAAGVAFMFQTKVGLGLTREGGRGFALRRLPACQHGEDKIVELPDAWSAPLFFTVSATGLGLSVGYGESTSVVVLETREAVTLFAEKQVEMGVGAKAALGASGEALPGNQAVVGGHPIADKNKVFTVVGGGLQIDLSINWPVTEPWAQMNRAVFFSGHDAPKDILSGAAQAPSVLGLQQLYQALAAVA